MDAIDAGDCEALEALLERHADLARASTEDGDTNRAGRTLLLYVATWPGGRPNAAACAEALLSAGSDPDVRFRNSETTLHWAASNDDDAQLITALVEGGAQVNVLGGVVHGGTPLLNAVHFGKRDAAAALVRGGAATGDLRIAAGLGDVKRIEELYCDDGRYAHVPDALTSEDTVAGDPLDADDSAQLAGQAFSCAVFCEQFGAADLLLAQGVDINAALDGTNVLHQAAYRGSLAMTMYLVARGADVNAPTAQIPGPAALAALAHGNAQRMNYLLDHGTDFSLEQLAHCGRLDRIIEHAADAYDVEALLAATVGTTTAVGKPVVDTVRRGRAAVARFLIQRDPGVLGEIAAGGTLHALAKTRADGDMLALYAEMAC